MSQEESRESMLGASPHLEAEAHVSAALNRENLEDLLSAIHAQAGEIGRGYVGGASLIWSSDVMTATRTGRRTMLKVRSGDGETRIDATEELGGMAGGIFGGLIGGVGLGAGLGVGLGVGLGTLASVPFAVGVPVVALVLSYALSRTVFRRAVSLRRQKLRRLVDGVREEAEELAREQAE
jgi:hypothetical protein